MKKRILALLLCLSLGLGMLLSFSGCGKDYEAEITVYNWGEYIDESTYKDFEKLYNVKVNYNTFDTNESLYSILELGGYDIDVIICSDYMVSRMVNEGMLSKLDYANIPNFDLIGEAYKNLPYDPQNEYTVPYMWGTVGLIYNSAMIEDEITSWSALFDEKYAGQITMIDNSRDALAIALLLLGYSVNTTNADEIREASALLEQQASVRQGWAMDQIFDKLEGGETAIGTYYAGDYLTMLENNPDLKFVLPEEGTTWFVDAMCVPATSTKQKYAELFIDYMASTDVMVRNMAETGYSSPNTEACEIYAEDLDEFSRQIMFPSDEVLSQYELFLNLPQDILDLYDELWVKINS